MLKTKAETNRKNKKVTTDISVAFPAAMNSAVSCMFSRQSFLHLLTLVTLHSCYFLTLPICFNCRLWFPCSLFFPTLLQSLNLTFFCILHYSQERKCSVRLRNSSRVQHIIQYVGTVYKTQWATEQITAFLKELPI